MNSKIKRDQDSVVIPITITYAKRRFALVQSTKMPDCPRPNEGSVSHFFNRLLENYADEFFKGKKVPGINSKS